MCFTAYCPVEVRSYSAHTTTSCLPRVGFVKLGGSTVWEHSWCGSFTDALGVSILKIDPFTCTQLESHTFNTHASASAATDLKNYLDGLSDGDLVIGVTGDEPSSNLANALSTLSAWGANVDDVGYRGSFAFVAQKGFASKTILDKVLTEEAGNIAPAKINAILQGNLYTLCHEKGSLTLPIVMWRRITRF